MTDHANPVVPASEAAKQAGDFIKQHVALPAELRNTPPKSADSAIGRFVFDVLLPHVVKGKVSMEPVLFDDGRQFYRIHIQQPGRRYSFVVTAMGAYYTGMSILTNPPSNIKMGGDITGTHYIPCWASQRVVEICGEICKKHEEELAFLQAEALRLRQGDGVGADEQEAVAEAALTKPTLH